MIDLTAEKIHEDLVKWWRSEVRKALKNEIANARARRRFAAATLRAQELISKQEGK